MTELNSCFLKSLLIFQPDSIPLQGMVWKKNQLHLNLSCLSCCEGRSVHLQANIHCALNYRYQRLLKLLQIYYDSYHSILNLSSLCHQSNEFIYKKIQAVQHLLENQQLPGGAYKLSNHPRANHLVWHLAIILTWRFGYNVHVFALGKTPQQFLWPFETKQPRYPSPDQNNSRHIVFVENLDLLYKDQARYQFENLVNAAYHGCSPMFLLMPHQADKPRNQDDSSLKPKIAKHLFSRKLSQLKQKDPLSFLSTDCKSKLSELDYYQEICGS